MSKLQSTNHIDIEILDYVLSLANGIQFISYDKFDKFDGVLLQTIIKNHSKKLSSACHTFLRNNV